MTAGTFEQAVAAAEVIRAAAVFTAPPRIAIVLGSGLGAFAAQLENATAIPYAAIPNFPQSTVAGHSGRLVSGALAGAPLLVMQGRVHGYEGYTAQQVVFPIRVLAQCGVRQLIVTNASGGIHHSLHQGQLVLLRDHINFTGVSPLTGPNDERFGPRFFDMSEAYSRRLREAALDAAAAIELDLREGVYLSVPGPSYETPAEIRAFRTLGADLVGMSTVHEVIAARHLGLEVLGISCVTNLAAGVQAAPLDHAEVMETGRRVEKQLTALLSILVRRMAAMDPA